MLEHKLDGCGKMSYTYRENVNMCRFNDKGFIYRLIEMDEDIPEWSAHDIDFDADIFDGLTQYIGMTSNPHARAFAHRNKKGNNMMMQIIASCGCETEAHYVECKKIWEYKKEFGKIPPLNKSGWSGA